MTDNNTQDKMSNEEFWEVVKFADWPSVVKADSQGLSDRAYDECKERLMEGPLPTFEDATRFENTLMAHRVALYKALEDYESERSYDERAEVSDDGLSDLLHHVIGLGEEAYTASLNDPSLMVARSKNYSNGEDGYYESFAYCIPYKEDYWSLEKKLVQARDGLNFWIGRAAEPDAPAYTHREVKRRIAEVNRIRAKIGVEPLRQQATDEQMLKTRLASGKSRLAQANDALAQALAEVERLKRICDSEQAAIDEFLAAKNKKA